MRRRQYLRGLFALCAGTVAGCNLGGRASQDEPRPDESSPPGVSETGIDPAVLAGTARSRIEAQSYAFGWTTEGEEMGRSFLRVRHDRERNRLHLRNREGGIHFAVYYGDDVAVRNDAPGDETAAYSRPTATRAERAETLPPALERLVMVWLSGYEYELAGKTGDGVTLDIVGGASQVPYELAEASGSLTVSGDGLPERLRVSGIPIVEAADGSREALDTGMDLSLSVRVGDLTVTEPGWVEVARERLDDPEAE